MGAAECEGLSHKPVCLLWSRTSITGSDSSRTSILTPVSGAAAASSGGQRYCSNSFLSVSAGMQELEGTVYGVSMQQQRALRSRRPLLVRHPLLHHFLPLLLPQTVEDKKIFPHQGQSGCRTLDVLILLPLSAAAPSFIFLLLADSLIHIIGCEEVRRAV